MWPLVGARSPPGCEHARALRAAAARGGGRGAAAVRGGPAGHLRRDDRRGRRGALRAERAAARGHAPSTSAPRASSPRRRRRAGDVRRAQRRHRGGSGAQLSAVLDKLGRMISARSEPRWCSGAGALVAALLALVVLRAPRATTRAAAQRHGDHPRTGGRQAPRPRADRRGDLRREQIRTAALLRGRAGPDADPARDRLLPRAALGRHALHRQRPRDAERSTSPTAATTCATCSTTTTATRCSRWPPTTAASRTSTAGWRRPRSGRQLTIEAIPFPETREYVQRVLDAQRYRGDYAHELGITELRPRRPRPSAPPRLSRWPAATVGARQRMPDFKLDSVFTPDRRPAEGDRGAGARACARASASRRCSARPAPARR